MVLKALLQQAGLNERVAGGLGSYCLLNLVMAHLMSEVSQQTTLRACLCSDSCSAVVSFETDYDLVKAAPSQSTAG